MGIISGSGGLGFGAAFTLDDNFSATADKIERKFGSLSNATDRASRKIAGGLTRIKKGFKQLAIGGAILLPFALAVNEAIKFETAFTGVRKTVELTNKEFDRLEDNLRSLSKQIPVTAIELSGIAEVAGQLGIKGVDNITKFTDTVAKIGVTTNLGSEEAAISFARIAGIINEPIENIDRMASSVVSLGNTFKTNEQEILSFATRIAGAGNLADITTANVFGISAAFSSVGIQAEAGGTSVQKVLNKMTTAVATGNKDLAVFAKTAGLSTKAFKNLAPIERFQAFVGGLGKQGKLATLTLDKLKLGNEAVVRSFLSLAGAGELLNETLADSDKAFRDNTALAKEAALRFATTASKAQILKNKFTDLLVTIGKDLKGAFDALIVVLGPVIEFFIVLVRSKIGKFIISLVVGVAALVVVMGILNIVIGAVSVAMGVFMTVILPILPILLAVVAVVAILIGTFKLVTSSMEAFKGVMAGGEIKSGFAGFMQKFGGILMGVMAIWKSATNDGFTLTVKMRDALHNLGILDFVLALGTWIVRLKAFFGGVWEGIKVVFGFVKQGFAIFMGIVKSALKAIDKAFGPIFGTLGKNTSSVNKWVKAGKLMGKIIGVLIATFLAPLAIVIAAITAVVIIIIGTFKLLVAGFGLLGDAISFVIDLWVSGFNFVKDIFFSLVDFFVNLPSKFVNVGSSMVLSIKEGIASAWASLKSFFTGLITDLASSVSDIFSFGDDSIEANINGPAIAGDDRLAGINESVANNQAAAATQNVNVQTGPVTAQAGDVKVTLELDGDVIADKMIEKQSLEDSRE